ncbi:MAG TPA: hypothetical protein VM509_13465, partial [Planctomycetota bacterium]|nr:hypothetical protein [Planctomycetota bacterium]
MERIAIAGISLRSVDVAALERVKQAACDELLFTRRAAEELAASELVLLSTCNRVELVFAREEGHLPCEADRATIARLLGLGDELRAALSLDCGLLAARRLFRIVCSLESLVLGEDQILAQAREAFARSERAGWCGPLLTPLFQRAFQIGKEVRTKTELGHHPVSIVSLGIAQLSALLPPGERDLAVLGAGNMAELAVKHAQSAGFTLRAVASRGLERARRLAEPHGAAVSCIDAFLRAGPPVHALIGATSASGIVVDEPALSALARRLPNGQRLIALDLAVPRDLAPTADPR